MPSLFHLIDDRNIYRLDMDDMPNELASRMVNQSYVIVSSRIVK